MKKQILITAIILSTLSSGAFAIDDNSDLKKFAETNIQEYFYQPPSALNNSSETTEESNSEKRTVYPIFKQLRIRLTNFYNEREYKNYQKLLEKQKNQYQENYTEEILRDVQDNAQNTMVTEDESKKSEEQISEDTLKLEGAVKQQVTSKDAQLDADKVRFNQETMDIIATGKPVLYFPPQKTTIKAKKMIYNHASNILKAIDNVEVIKDGQTSHGDYLELNMNEETGFLDNVKSEASVLTVNARKATMDEKQVILYDGEMVSEHSFILRLETEMVGGYEYRNMVVPKDQQSKITDVIGDTKINVQSDEIIINAKKYNDTITLKKSKIRYGDVELFRIPSMTFHTNKNHDYFEANYPELGSRSMIGMFAGPGFVLDTPLQKGSSIKIIPIVNNGGGKFGFGGLAKYRSATNSTMFGYTSSYNRPVLQGYQKLDDKLSLQYGMNSYMDEWFLGYRMAKYNAELLYKDETVIPKTFADNLGFTYKQRVGLGYMHDNDFGNSSDGFRKDNLGTMRARYMAEAIQDLYKYEKPEEGLMFKISLILQGSAAVYGTGDTQFIGRVGSGIETQYKRWFQSLRYYASAYQDGSPMQAYDGYRYGHGSFYIREAFRICKYLTIAWSAGINTTNDAPNSKFFQENAFLLMIGPDDFKIHIGYDWEREQTFVNCVIAMDTKGSSLGYKKLVIKNPDRLAKNDLNQPELKVFDNMAEDKKKPKTKKRMMYAEVIDIEDPDKEQI